MGMTTSSRSLPRIGGFLVELERLERAQRPGVFLVDRVEATPHGVALLIPSGAEVLLPPDASTIGIGEALHAPIPHLQVPAADTETPFSAEPDVPTQ